MNADVTGLVNKNTVGYTEDGTSWPAHDEDGLMTLPTEDSCEPDSVTSQVH